MKHSLTDINETLKTATCSICGPNSKLIQRGTQSTGKSKWRCHVGKNSNRTRNKRNLSQKEYEQLKSVNKCQICGKSQTGRQLNIDHCHKTNKVRGLLCDSCNLGIGHFNDDLSLLLSAIKYLSKQMNEP